MTPCPPEALPIIEIIRREVPRPGRPNLLCYESLRWFASESRSDTVKSLNDDCCLLGLRKDAKDGSPINRYLAGLSSQLRESFSSFVNWFDSLREPDIDEMMDFVWPVEQETDDDAE